jgi:hypothetical protein
MRGLVIAPEPQAGGDQPEDCRAARAIPTAAALSHRDRSHRGEWGGESKGQELGRIPTELDNVRESATAAILAAVARGAE